MARIAGTTCGWESGIADEGGTPVILANTTEAVVTATPAPKSGTYCWKVNITATGINGCQRLFSLGASLTDVWVRMGVYAHLSSAGEIISNGNCLWVAYDSAGTLIAALYLDSATDTLRAVRGGSFANSDYGGGTLLGSASATLTQDAWHKIDIHYVPTTGGTGTFEVWIDGTRVINVTATQTSAGLANIALYGVGHRRCKSGVANVYVGFDDLGCNDTSGAVNTGRLADNLITWLVPNGAGASTNWTPSAGSNYQCVDEIPPSATDYVSTTAAATVDDYAMTNLPATAGTIPFVEVVAYAKNPDGGAGQLKVGIISGANTTAGSAQALTATDLFVRNPFEQNPDGTVAWTKAAVDAAKARLESA